MIRWFLDGTRVKQLAADNQVSPSTGYAYLHEGIRVLAAHAPGLESVLRASQGKCVSGGVPRSTGLISGQMGHHVAQETFKALRNVSLCPSNIGRITAAALVLLHIDHAAQHDHPTPPTVTRKGSFAVTILRVTRDKATGEVLEVGDLLVAPGRQELLYEV